MITLFADFTLRTPVRTVAAMGAEPVVIVCARGSLVVPTCLGCQAR